MRASSASLSWQKACGKHAVPGGIADASTLSSSSRCVDVGFANLTPSESAVVGSVGCLAMGEDVCIEGNRWLVIVTGVPPFVSPTCARFVDGRGCGGAEGGVGSACGMGLHSLALVDVVPSPTFRKNLAKSRVSRMFSVR